MPIAVHLVWRFAGIATVWWMFDAIWALFAATVAADLWRSFRGRISKGFWSRPLLAVGGVATVLWMALSLGSLLDLRMGQRQYFSVTAFDYMTRIPMASAIAQRPACRPKSGISIPGRRLFCATTISGR